MATEIMSKMLSCNSIVSGKYPAFLSCDVNLANFRPQGSFLSVNYDSRSTIMR